MAMDVLSRLHLPLSGLRGQTYDGAANMSGKYSGAQAVIKKKQPLSLYVHCGARCVNLVTQKACTASKLLRNSLDWVHQLGNLYSLSGKFKEKFNQIARADYGIASPLKPLCQTRWTVRHQAVTSVLKQYDSVLTSLEEMSNSNAPSAATANGLHQQFLKGQTLLGLVLAGAVIGELECLNASLQRKTQTISGMKAAISCVQSVLKDKRNEDAFQSLFEQANVIVDSLNLEPF